MSESEASAPAVPSPKNRRYPKDFQQDAVRLVTDEKYTFKAAAQAVGVSEKSLRDWHKKHAPPPVPCGDDATVAELQVENKRLRKQLKRAERHERIKQSVQQVYTQSNSIYGSAKIAERLQKRDDLESACRNTVATAMQELGIKSRVSKSFTPTTTMADPSKRPAENKLDPDFTAEAPNRKWVTDITYLPTATGWVYLAVVLDLFGRKVVGWSIGHSLATGHWRPSWSARLCEKPLKIVVPMAASCCTLATVVVSTPATLTRRLCERSALRVR